VNLLQITKMTEGQARSYLEGIRWPNGPVCPHCGNTEKIYRLSGESTREGLYKCGACRKQFTVTVGTVMHRSHLTCKQWVVAFHLMCSSKKGISALQLQRELGMQSYEAAWFMAHRIRAAMEAMGMLSGTVEVDETYVGGKTHWRPGDGPASNKSILMAMVSRQGDVETRSVPNVKWHTVQRPVIETVKSDSRIMTDESKSYIGIGAHFKGGHHTVCHSVGEYSRGDVHINTAEAYFSLLKRGVHGTFHHVSKKHLARYAEEFNFRWNNRKVTDGERTDAVIAQVIGKRLTYDQLVERDK
jgi:transposase-like protein